MPLWLHVIAQEVLLVKTKHGEVRRGPYLVALLLPIKIVLAGRMFGNSRYCVSINKK